MIVSLSSFGRKRRLGGHKFVHERTRRAAEYDAITTSTKRLAGAYKSSTAMLELLELLVALAPYTVARRGLSCRSCRPTDCTRYAADGPPKRLELAPRRLQLWRPKVLCSLLFLSRCILSTRFPLVLRSRHNRATLPVASCCLLTGLRVRLFCWYFVARFVHFINFAFIY